MLSTALIQWQFCLHLMFSRNLNSMNPLGWATGPKSRVKTMLRVKSSSNGGGWFCKEKLHHHHELKKSDRKTHITSEQVAWIEVAWLRHWQAHRWHDWWRSRFTLEWWQNAIVGDALPNLPVDWKLRWTYFDSWICFVLQWRHKWWSCDVERQLERRKNVKAWTRRLPL